MGSRDGGIKPYKVEGIKCNVEGDREAGPPFFVCASRGLVVVRTEGVGGDEGGDLLA